jgi:hypothetical protein
MAHISSHAGRINQEAAVRQGRETERDRQPASHHLGSVAPLAVVAPCGADQPSSA